MDALGPFAARAHSSLTDRHCGVSGRLRMFEYLLNRPQQPKSNVNDGRID